MAVSSINRKFVVDLGWRILLKDLGLSVPDLLRRAELPLDLFNQKSPSLTSEEYFRLWDSVTELSGEPTFPLKLVQAFTAEMFNPPLFAAFCSPNLNVALERLARYKPLIGPMRLDVQRTTKTTSITIKGLPENKPPSASMIAMELKCAWPAFSK